MKWWTVLVFCCAAFGQQQAGRPEFEVASIKPAEPMPVGQMRIGMNADAGMLRYVNVSLKDVIRAAYRMKDFQVQGPDWLANTRFDITAKLPDGSSKDQVPEMLQALLAERFKLEVHRESKEHAVYALVAGKGGPKLKAAEVQTNDKAAVAGPAKAEIPPKPAGVQTSDKAVAIAGTAKGEVSRNAMMIAMGPDGAHLKAPSVTLAAFADMLSRFAERPVLDMTGIQGQYEFDLVFAPEQLRGMPGMMRGPMPPGGAERPAAADTPSQPAASIFDSVQQYGLKLEPRKAPLEFLIVDKVEKTPTEN